MQKIRGLARQCNSGAPAARWTGTGSGFAADTPVDYQSDADHFKYGSVGSEHEFGVPYWIWRALPVRRVNDFMVHVCGGSHK